MLSEAGGALLIKDSKKSFYTKKLSKKYITADSWKVSRKLLQSFLLSAL